MSFDTDADKPIEQAPAKLLAFELPAGVSLSVHLQTEINSSTSAVGDLMEATLTKDVKKEGELIAPRGSRVLGRIRRLDHFTDPENRFIVGLEFTELRTPNRRAPLRVELTYMTPIQGLAPQFGDERTKSSSRAGGTGFLTHQLETTIIEDYGSPALPGTSELYLKGDRFRIPAGVTMVLKTLDASPNSLSQ